VLQETIEKRTKSLFRRLSLLYLILLLIVLLMPFSFTPDPALISSGLRRVFSVWPARSVLDPALLADLIQNFVLFLPFGFLCREAVGGTFRAALAGFLVSLCVESLQLTMPQRVASAYDLATNTAGALAGAVLAGLLSGPIHGVASRLLARRPSRGTLLVGAAGSVGVAFFLLFFPVVRAERLSWPPDSPLALGGIPGDRSWWKGVIHRISLWTRVFPDEASLEELPPVLDWDFRAAAGEGRFSLLRAPGREAAWTPEGLRVGTGPVWVSEEAARRFNEITGRGKPFTIRLWLSPERLDAYQEGMAAAAGTRIRQCDFYLRQEGRTVKLFVRTTVSGREWDAPDARFYNCLSDRRPQRWTFFVDSTTIRAFADGTPCSPVFYLKQWTSPAGLLLASPFVMEKLALFSVLFAAYEFFLYLLLAPRSRSKWGWFALGGLFGPAAAATAVCAISGVPVDPLLLLGIAIGAALGSILGGAWRHGTDDDSSVCAGGGS